MILGGAANFRKAHAAVLLGSDMINCAVPNISDCGSHGDVAARPTRATHRRVTRQPRRSHCGSHSRTAISRYCPARNHTSGWRLHDSRPAGGRLLYCCQPRRNGEKPADSPFAAGRFDTIARMECGGQPLGARPRRPPKLAPAASSSRARPSLRCR